MKQCFLLISILIIFLPVIVFAQVTEDGPDVYVIGDDMTFGSDGALEQKGTTIDYSIPKDFDGTFSDEDPDSEVFKEKILFGEEGDENVDDLTIIEGPTHLLKMDFEAQVVVTDTLTDMPYLEINYNLKLEEEIEVIQKRYRTTAKAEIITDVVGELAGNELFTCKLDIQLDEVEADIMTRYTHMEETEEEDEFFQMAVQVKFKRNNLLERWMSNCLGTDGSIFNTEGDKERYLLTTLEEVTPELTGILIEDYDIEAETTVDLETEPLIIEDEGTHEEFQLQGSGMLTITPL